MSEALLIFDYNSIERKLFNKQLWQDMYMGFRECVPEFKTLHNASKSSCNIDFNTRNLITNIRDYK